MSKFGCPDKFVEMVKQFHDGMQASVQGDGEHSASFPVTNGVEQGCVLAPTLFSIVFSAMWNDAYREGKVGVDFYFQTDGKLFNLRTLQAKSKVTKDTAQDFLFADGCALNAANQSDMQRSMDLFATACNNFGLTISTKKDRGDVPASPRYSLHRSCHLSKRPEISVSREICLPW